MDKAWKKDFVEKGFHYKGKKTKKTEVING
jgi:hypothetical protein